MRFRPLVALSAAAVSVVLLAGCTASADPEDSPTPAESGAADLCDAAVESGDASDAITVDGELGAVSTATFEAPLTIDTFERSVVTEGKGDPIKTGDYINYALTAFDAETGDVLGSIGYEPGEILPEPISPEAGIAQVVGCAAPGSRFTAAAPAAEAGTAQVYIVDLLGVTPTAAWGESQDPVEGMPKVTLADDGEPSVEMPDTDPPAELQLSVLKKGDGIEVGEGDTTLLQYYGADWDTGESFDASWPTPYSLTGNQYVPGFVEALVGQAVGSQVLVVIPPALAYGEAGSSDHQLAGKTLVFVVDILATQHAAPQ